MVAQPDYTFSKTGTVLQRLVIMAGFFSLLFILLILLMPNVEQSRGQARRSGSKYNMKQIGIALHNYHDQHQLFPPGAIETAAGTPYHSWQAQILPYIDLNHLYRKIDFNKPWTDPTHQPIFKQEISLYLNPAIQETTSPEGYALSHYVGNELLLKKNASFRIREVTDGLSNTIMAMEIGENFKPWGDPTNINEPVKIMGPGKKTPFRDGNHVLFSDGSVRFVSRDIDPTILKELSTPAGGEAKCGF